MVKLIAIAFICLFVGAANAHPGGKDAKGCHSDKKAGTRHCH